MVGKRWCSIWVSSPPNMNPVKDRPDRFREVSTWRRRNPSSFSPARMGMPTWLVMKLAPR